MEDLFDPTNPRLDPNKDRFALVGSNIPEEKFIYKVRTLHADGYLPTPEELVRLANEFDVDIWPLEAWARRGNSLEHRACLELCRRAEAHLSKKYLLEEIAEMSGSDFDAKNLGGLEHELLRSIRNRMQAENNRESQARYQDLIDREAAARRERIASMTPEAIEAERITARLIDLTMSLRGAVNDENVQYVKLLVERSEEFIGSLPEHYGENPALDALRQAVSDARARFNFQG